MDLKSLFQGMDVNVKIDDETQELIDGALTVFRALTEVLAGGVNAFKSWQVNQSRVDAPIMSFKVADDSWDKIMQEMRDAVRGVDKYKSTSNSNWSHDGECEDDRFDGEMHDDSVCECGCLNRAARREQAEAERLKVEQGFWAAEQATRRLANKAEREQNAPADGIGLLRKTDGVLNQDWMARYDNQDGDGVNVRMSSGMYKEFRDFLNARYPVAPTTGD